MRLGALFLLVYGLAFGVDGQRPVCVCDHATHAAFDTYPCGLCAVADSAPPDVPVVFLKDGSPSKPHRWLALPRGHGSEPVELLRDLSPAERAELWREAIAKAQEQWGDHWGVAMNGAHARTQCHLHIHIGKLLDGVEWGDFKEISGPEEIPDSGEMGIWVHPGPNGKLHVHVEMLAETVLAR